MIDIELQRKSLDEWRVGISKRFRKNAEIAQGEVRQAWQAELYRQQATQGDGTWQALNPIYEARRDKKFPQSSGKILSRTGRMLDGYVNGIRFSTTNSTVVVIMPFPPSTIEDRTINVRAKTHQGFERGASPLPVRAFDIDKFEEIASDIFNAAMRKSAE